jgi:hypothetical protein
MTEELQYCRWLSTTYQILEDSYVLTMHYRLTGWFVAIRIQPVSSRLQWVQSHCAPFGRQTSTCPSTANRQEQNANECPRLRKPPQTPNRPRHRPGQPLQMWATHLTSNLTPPLVVVEGCGCAQNIEPHHWQPSQTWNTPGRMAKTHIWQSTNIPFRYTNELHGSTLPGWF